MNVQDWVVVILVFLCFRVVDIQGGLETILRGVGKFSFQRIFNKLDVKL